GADIEEQPDRTSAGAWRRALTLGCARRRPRDGWRTTGPRDTRIDRGRRRGVLPHPGQVGLAVRRFGRRGRKIDFARLGPRHALGLIGRPLRLDHHRRQHHRADRTCREPHPPLSFIPEAAVSLARFSNRSRALPWSSVLCAWFLVRMVVSPAARHRTDYE